MWISRKQKTCKKTKKELYLQYQLIKVETPPLKTVKNKMLLEVNTTKVKQDANDILGTKEKMLYYLLIGTGENKLVINVGEKTYATTSKLIAQSTINEKK